MDAELYLAFLGLSAALIAAPGPNVLLVVSRSVSHGPASGLRTVLGTSSGMAVQLALAILGTSSLLLLVSEAFEWIRWAGVAYLLLLGIRQWRGSSAGSEAARSGPRRTVVDGFLVSASNPKTLLFFAAFLPQFIDASRAAIPQLLLLGASFLALAVVVDSAYAWLAGTLRASVLATERGRAGSRASAALPLCAAAGLTLAHPRAEELRRRAWRASRGATSPRGLAGSSLRFQRGEESPLSGENAR